LQPQTVIDAIVGGSSSSKLDKTGSDNALKALSFGSLEEHSGHTCSRASAMKIQDLMLYLCSLSMLLVVVYVNEGLAGTRQPPQPEQGPSLGETLSWLSEKVPPYSYYKFRFRDKNTDKRGSPVENMETIFKVDFLHFNGAVMSLQTSHISRTLESPPRELHIIKSESSYNVNLGHLKFSGIEQQRSTTCIDNCVYWSISLLSNYKIKEYRKVYFSDGSIENVDDDSHVVSIWGFTDEDVARRIHRAFEHAINLSQKKEPF